MISLVVAADVRFYRDGLAESISRHPGLSVLGTASGRSEAIGRVRELGPDILLLDAMMPEGLRTAAELDADYPNVKVIVTALVETPLTVLEWAEAGVAGYVQRDASLADLVATIERTARGELQCSTQVAAVMLRRLGALAKVANERKAGASLSQLSPREREIMHLIDQGMSNKDIARHLGIGVATAKSHVHHILEKLNVRRRSQAAARVRQGG